MRWYRDGTRIAAESIGPVEQLHAFSSIAKPILSLPLLGERLVFF